MQDGKRYNMVYRCRLCGERFTSGVIWESDEVASLFMSIIEGKRAIATGHECYGGDMGIAESIGFKEVKDAKKTGEKRCEE